MKSVFFSSLLLLISPIVHSATPIDGWYASGFGGYAYIPNNINITHQALTYTDASYQPGFDAGGNLGYKSNPMRYEGELTFLNANVNHFDQNHLNQTRVGGYNNGVLGMANVYYDFPGLIPCLQPFLGVGIGYEWLNVQLDNLLPTDASTLRVTSSTFAYQGVAGITYNFAENYALNISYRYFATPHVFDLGHVFQASLGNLGVTYRFDYDRFK